MAGRGRAPNVERRNRAPLTRGDWRAVPGTGWQHGEPPDPPEGLLEVSRKAWATWMASWVAAHWSRGDIPGLGICVQLYDAVERGERQRSTELRLWLDSYGITPKGQQDRRWVRAEPVSDRPRADPYEILRGHHRAMLPEAAT